jgi:hypothetical protein
MKARWLTVLGLLAGAALAQSAAEFAWRGTLATPDKASLMRVALPSAALVRLQGAQAQDVRIFDAQGQPVPFALAQPPAQPSGPRDATPRYPALRLYGSAPPRAGGGGVQVRIDEGGTQRSVWVQMKPGASAPANADAPLPSVLFDTRGEKRSVSALVVHGQIPSNRPVTLRVSTSADLAQWTPARVRGPVFRFEGANAPRNDTLEFETPLALEGRYLRLDWQGEQDIAVEGVTGLVAKAAPKRQLVGATLPPGRADGASALEWELGFATPIAEMQLTTQRHNTLVPVRVLGRNQLSEPWRELARAVVWRLGVPGSEHANPATPMPQASVRWLRVEATHGMKLEGLPLAVSVAFEPVQLVFVAGGEGPYQVAAGRADTASSALPLSMIATAANVKIDELPLATVAQENAPAERADGIRGWLPRGVEPRTALLWAVLLAGVALLGGVAWSLLRQVNK